MNDIQDIRCTLQTHLDTQNKAWQEQFNALKSLVTLTAPSVTKYVTKEAGRSEANTNTVPPESTSVISVQTQTHHSPKYFLFQGKEDPLSNLFPCSLEAKIDTSLEQAYQHQKALFLKESNLADNIILERDAAVIKRMANKLNSHDNITQWNKHGGHAIYTKQEAYYVKIVKKQAVVHRRGSPPAQCTQ